MILDDVKMLLDSTSPDAVVRKLLFVTTAVRIS